MPQRHHGGNDIQLVLTRYSKPRVSEWWPGLYSESYGDEEKWTGIRDGLNRAW